MYGLLLATHILICFSLIVVVLLQSGKGGGLAGGAFGGTAQTVFGGRGATDFMTRATMVLGGAFFLTSLVLALLSSGAGRSTRSLIQEEARRAPAAAPQLPGTVPGQPPAQGAPSPPAAPQQTPPAGAQPATLPPGGGGK
ncbi:MAG: preprotein translocase subunit SecG [Candidatus Eisenbacteria bacterium]